MWAMGFISILFAVSYEALEQCRNDWFFSIDNGETCRHLCNFFLDHYHRLLG